jgi:hypothetical protein
VDSLSAYASFALHAKDMAVSPALRAAETATQKCHCFAKRIDNPVIHVGSLSAYKILARMTRISHNEAWFKVQDAVGLGLLVPASPAWGGAK